MVGIFQPVIRHWNRGCTTEIPRSLLTCRGLYPTILVGKSAKQTSTFGELWWFLITWDKTYPFFSITTGQIIMFHHPRFLWNKGISRNLSYLFGVKTRVRSLYFDQATWRGSKNPFLTKHTNNWPNFSWHPEKMQYFLLQGCFKKETLT